MIVYKLLISNSAMLIVDSGIDGYMKAPIPFMFILILYFFSLADIMFFAYFFLRKKEIIKQHDPKMYYQTAKGYTCLQHHLYDMDYIQATSHFWWEHKITLDEVENE